MSLNQHSATGIAIFIIGFIAGIIAKMLWESFEPIEFKSPKQKLNTNQVSKTVITTPGISTPVKTTLENETKPARVITTDNVLEELPSWLKSSLVKCESLFENSTTAVATNINYYGARPLKLGKSVIDHAIQAKSNYSERYSVYSRSLIKQAGLVSRSALAKQKSFPQNSFTKLLKMLAFMDISVAVLTLLTLFICLMFKVDDTGDIGKYPSLVFINIITNYCFHVICFLGLAISFIPFKIIVFNGTIESIKANTALGICLFAGVPFIIVSVVKYAKDISDSNLFLEIVLDAIVIWGSMIGIFVILQVCLLELSKQRERRKMLHTEYSFMVDDIYNHQPILIMIKFLKYFMLVYVIFFITTFGANIVGIIQMVYHNDVFDNMASILFYIVNIAILLSGLLHAIAVHIGLQKIKLPTVVRVQQPVSLRNFITPFMKSRPESRRESTIGDSAIGLQIVKV
ncbi:hypothetical protein HDV06_002521 [Boothiomyces sp. JEL0866]|nr:hypothetical protein HDV06_002521 [Boothiomyces sp. JEL0866]